MGPQQRSEVIDALEQSKADFLAAADVPESFAARKPAEGRWSVLDCIEHVTRVEESFLERLQPADGDPPPLSAQREAELASRMADRTERRQAPEALRPTGRFATLAEAREAFRASRARVQQFAAEHSSDLISFTASSPRWGVMNGREVLLLVAGHSRRHAAQIRETMETLTMSPQQKSEIADVLEQSRQEFLAAADVPDSVAKMKPAEGRWSVLDCIEHVCTVEERFLGRLAPPESGSAPPADKEKEAALTARVVDRTERRQAPEAIHPKGRFATLADGLEEFNAVRARTAKFAEDRAADLYSLSVLHPVLGPLNGMETLTLIAGHSCRHAAQMREAAAAVSAKQSAG